MDSLRSFLWMTLCVVLIMILDAWYRDYHYQLPDETKQKIETVIKQEQAKLPQSDAAPTPKGDEDAPPAVAQTTTPGATPDAAAAMKSAGRIRVSTDVYDAEIDSAGGDIRVIRLRKYPVSRDKPNDPLELLTDDSSRLFMPQSGMTGDSAAPSHQTVYQAEKSAYALADGTRELEVVLNWQSDTGVKFKKTFVFHRDNYLIDLRYEVQNAAAQPWNGRLYAQLQRDIRRVDVSNRFITTYTGAAISSPEKRYEKLQPKDLRAQNLDREITGGWAAIVQHYFLAALLPKSDEVYRYYTKFLQSGRYIVGMYGPTQTVAPGASATQSIRFYAGPKNQEILETIAPNLELSADYGSLWFIAKPLFWLLNNLHRLVGNWGLSIILLTLIVKAAFFKLSAFSYKSMANLRKLQPKMADLKERYGEDKAKMSQLTMELYRKEKVNPLGGCLPILVQVPVFISLYWVLLETVELRNAGFMGWIKDLSTPDPYFILPVLMGISMFIQNRLNPPAQDPIQAKVLASFPIVFSIFFAYFPAGLVLYWVCNNTLSIAQQWVITRKIMGEPARR